jgi:GntR family galactonate operon transcriptional repressor
VERVKQEAEKKSAPDARRKRPGQADLYFSPSSSAVNLASRIGRDIVEGRYAERKVLPNETEMRETYSVSRTALREAYSKLTAKGLLAPRPKVGTTVRAREDWNMLDQDVLGWHLQVVPASEIATELYALRRMVEPGAAALAAERWTEADLVEINSALEAMRRNANDEKDLVEADFAFHTAILRATQNPFINAFSALIRAAMLSTFELSWRGAEVIKDTRLQQHADVARAIGDRHAAKARADMERLLDESINDVIEATKLQ